MSEAYEGVVFRSDEPTARQLFDGLASPLRLRLVQLADEVFGIYRVAGRSDAFDSAAVCRIAEQASAGVKQAVSLFYDNRCDVRGAVLYADGKQSREFGDDDARWVPLDDDGEPILDGPQVHTGDLDPDEEYDCIYSAIDAGLAAINAGSRPTAEEIKQAFCYDAAETIAESVSAS